MITAATTQTKAQVNWLALFVSDIHLSPDLPKTTQAFLDFLQSTATQTASLYLLGDMFEYWVGDDDLDSEFHRPIVAALKELSQQTQLFWISGNRDFLVADRFLNTCNLNALPDPATIELSGKRLALTHGDLLCTDDHSYQNFRTQVRSTSWQTQFLSQSLAQRKAIATHLRQQSQMAQQNTAASIIDANEQACANMQQQLAAQLLIHGHTHRPAIHLTPQCQRIVLPDWDLDAEVPRGGWLGLTPTGLAVLHQFCKAEQQFQL